MRWHAEWAWVGDTVAPDVLIEASDGRFSAVTAGVEAPADAVRLPGVTLPGLANTHSHAFHRALRGRTAADRGSFWTWREGMYTLADRLDPDTYLELARATYAEMALAGITCVGEFHYLHRDRGGRAYADPAVMGKVLIEAAAQAGIRITLLDTLYLTSTVDGEPLRGVQRRFGDGDLDGWVARTARTGARGRRADRRGPPLGAGGAGRADRPVRRAQRGPAAALPPLRAAGRERGVPGVPQAHSDRGVLRRRRAGSRHHGGTRHPPHRPRPHRARRHRHRRVSVPDDRARPRGRDRSGAGARRRRQPAQSRQRQQRGDRPVRGGARGGDGRRCLADSEAVSPHGMTTTRSGRAAASAPQRTVRESTPASPIGSVPPASSIISGTQWPPMNGGSSHSRASDAGRVLGRADRLAHRARSGARGRCAARRRARAIPIAARERLGVSEDLAEGRGVERDHLRMRRQPLGDRADVVVGDGADVAQRLGDDQVDVELAQRRLVELVERVAAAGHLAHARRRSRRAAGRPGSRCGSGAEARARPGG